MVKTINKVNNKVKETTAKVEKVIREIMLDDKGQRVHKMNINMKNKLLANLEFDNSKEFNNKSNKTISLKSNKHYIRFLSELKVANCTSKNIAKNNNELVNIRSNTKYWVAIVEEVKYLVRANKGMIEGYLRIVD